MFRAIHKWMSNKQNLIGINELCNRLGTGDKPLAKPTAYWWVREGYLVPPVKFGRSSRWILAEVMAVIAARCAGKGNDEVRLVVRDLIAARAEAHLPATSQETA